MPSALYALKNWRSLLRSWLTIGGARFGKQMGALTMVGELRARHYIEAEDRWVDLGLLSARMVTNAGVTFMRDDFNLGASDINLFNFHASGTGVAAEAVTDTALGTEVETRDAGTRSVPAFNQYRSVGLHTYGGTFAITEHGFFSASAGVTLWDRSVFAAINVVSGDKIEFTYTLTINAGG